MNHDELLTIVSVSESFLKEKEQFLLAKQMTALRAVVELHKPLVLQNCADVECCGNGNYCSHCVEEATDYYNHPYPCPTIQAIEKELV